jgi:dihydroorotate dehydrogenase
MYQGARAFLFRLGGGDAEVAHEWTLKRLAAASGRPWLLRALSRRYAVSAPVDVFGIRFPNPVGLAAGMDKNGVALPVWPSLGFGFVEVGTVTSRAQPGNERPRMFRLPSSAALINRMGFNNAGAHALATRLEALGPLPVPLGISLGKSKVTPLVDAVTDYLDSLRVLYPYGDYFAVNVSSPNTPGLRSLQDRGQLNELLKALREEATRLAPSLPTSSALTGEATSPGHGPATGPSTGSGPSAAAAETAGPARGAGAAGSVGAAGTAGPARGAGTAGPARAAGAAGAAEAAAPVAAGVKPILVKIAPDLTDVAIAELLAVCLEYDVAGVIATNTTLSRSGLATQDAALGNQAGGLSGRPLTQRAREVVRFVHRETDGRLPIIGVGGILEPDDAVRLVDAGARLVQLYTGLVFRGPDLVRRTVRALRG